MVIVTVDAYKMLRHFVLVITYLGLLEWTQCPQRADLYRTLLVGQDWSIKKNSDWIKIAF